MKQYFYIDSNNQQIGPISEDALIALLKCGAISRQTLIWAEGMPSWQPVCAVFPESAKETCIPPLGVEPSTTVPEAPAASLPQEQPKLWSKYRKIFIIGGIVAIIAAAFAWNDRRDAAASTEYESLNAIEEECDEEQEQKHPLEEFIEQRYGTHCWHCNGTGVTHTANRQYEIICPRCQGTGFVRK